MTSSFRLVATISVIIIISCVGLLIVTCPFIEWDKMESTSMDSAIPKSKGLLYIKKGDYAFAFKRIRHPLHRGDLVLVTYTDARDKNPVTTVRRIAGVPGDTANDGATIPNGYYELLGDSTNAIDSRQLGLFKYGQINGKVVWVME